MQAPPESRNDSASIIDTLLSYDPGSIAKLRASLDSQAMKLVEKDQLIKEQRNTINNGVTRNKKLTKLYKSEQGHRFRLENEVADLSRQVRKYKALCEELKDADEWRNMHRIQQQQIDGLLDEQKQLNLTIAHSNSTIKTLKDQVGHGEKKVSGLQDEIAYLETRNLGLRDELLAKDTQHRHEDNETANYYREKLGSHEHVIEVLHNLAEQDGDGLSLAAYFAKVLKIEGLQLHTLGIDEHRVDVLFDFVRNGQPPYAAFQPQTFERGFRCKARPPELGVFPASTPTLPNALGSALAASAAPLTPDTRQPKIAPGQAGQTAQLGPPHVRSGDRPPPPPPPFPAEIMNNRQDHDNLESPFAGDLFGEYLKPKLAKEAEEKIKAWKKKLMKWEKQQEREIANNRDNKTSTGSTTNNWQPPTSPNADSTFGQLLGQSQTPQNTGFGSGGGFGFGSTGTFKSTGIFGDTTTRNIEYRTSGGDGDLEMMGEGE